jgi:hypothetical protein
MNRQNWINHLDRMTVKLYRNRYYSITKGRRTRGRCWKSWNEQVKLKHVTAYTGGDQHMARVLMHGT